MAFPPSPSITPTNSGPLTSAPILPSNPLPPLPFSPGSPMLPPFGPGQIILNPPVYDPGWSNPGPLTPPNFIGGQCSIPYIVDGFINWDNNDGAGTRQAAFNCNGGNGIMGPILSISGPPNAGCINFQGINWGMLTAPNWAINFFRSFNVIRVRPQYVTDDPCGNPPTTAPPPTNPPQISPEDGPPSDPPPPLTPPVDPPIDNPISPIPPFPTSDSDPFPPLPEFDIPPIGPPIIQPTPPTNFVPPLSPTFLPTPLPPVIVPPIGIPLPFPPSNPLPSPFPPDNDGNPSPSPTPTPIPVIPTPAPTSCEQLQECLGEILQNTTILWRVAITGIPLGASTIYAQNGETIYPQAGYARRVKNGLPLAPDLAIRRSVQHIECEEDMTVEVLPNVGYTMVAVQVN